MAKSNAKSIRLSNKVLKYIEDYQGNGFNEKFENIILFAMESEKERKELIAYYDESIENRIKDLNELLHKIYTLKLARNKIDSLISIANDLEIEINKL